MSVPSPAAPASSNVWAEDLVVHPGMLDAKLRRPPEQPRPRSRQSYAPTLPLARELLKNKAVLEDDDTDHEGDKTSEMEE